MLLDGFLENLDLQLTRTPAGLGLDAEIGSRLAAIFDILQLRGIEIRVVLDDRAGDEALFHPTRGSL